MSCNCCGPSSPRSALPIAAFLVLLAGAAVLGVGALIGEVGRAISIPQAAWIPLAMAAVPGTVFGLWLGFRQHGRAEPLAVGVFGLTVGLLGLLIGYPVAVLGVAITLGAAIWSGLMRGTHRRPG